MLKIVSAVLNIWHNTKPLLKCICGIGGNPFCLSSPRGGSQTEATGTSPIDTAAHGFISGTEMQ